MVITDQRALRAVFARRDNYGHLACWVNFLAQYDLEVPYCTGHSKKQKIFCFVSSMEDPVMTMTRQIESAPWLCTITLRYSVKVCYLCWKFPMLLRFPLKGKALARKNGLGSSLEASMDDVGPILKMGKRLERSCPSFREGGSDEVSS